MSQVPKETEYGNTISHYLNLQRVLHSLGWLPIYNSNDAMPYLTDLTEINEYTKN
jgi:hypothetical protein